MAAPATMVVPNVNGSFYLNRNLSDPQDEVLTLQSFPYFLRQIAKLATIKLTVISSPSSTPPNITLTTSVSKLGWLGEAPLRAVGLSATKSETRLLDGTEFTDEEPVVGKVVGKMWVVTVANLLKKTTEEKEQEGLDEFLLEGWEGEEFVIRLSAHSAKGEEDPEPWGAEHVWGFQMTGKGSSDGEARRYVGKMRVTKTTKATREKKSGNCRLVHDYAGAN